MESPRYVILHHMMPLREGRGDHFDLMFETERGLQTWAVETLPVPQGPAVPAEALPLHRLAYLEYEGPVSNNRGTVQRVHWGTYVRLLDEPNSIEFQLLDRANPDAVSDRVFAFTRLAADHIDGCDRGWKLSIKTPPSRTPMTSRVAN